MWISGAIANQILAKLGALTTAVQQLTREARMTDQAMTDLVTAVTNLGDALAGEIGAVQAEVSALKAAIAAGTATPEDTAGIEANVTNLNNFVAQLKAQTAASQADTASLAPPAAPSAPAASAPATPPASS